MRFFSPLLILAALLAAACGGAAVFPEVFSQERADGKIPVNIELIRKQTQKEIDGMPEKQATAERWRDIEADYNDCRVSSARKTKAEADKVFADCMSRKGYVYMLRLDAEQLHDEIAAAEPAKYAAEKKAEEEARIAAEKLRKEKVAAAERRRKAKRLAAEKKAEQDKKDSNLRAWARDGNVEHIRAWLAEGANPNAATDDGWTALMWAAHKGYPEVAKVLLAAGANPNATRSKTGWAALMWTADKGHPEVAKVLLAAGANVNATGDNGYTALILAANNGHAEVVKVFLSAGANPNIASNSGWTALMSAASKNQPEVAKVLLAAGANPNTKQKRGYTALMYAGIHGQYEIVRLLLDCGASMALRNKKSNSIWDWADNDSALYGILTQRRIQLLTGQRISSCKNRWSWHTDISTSRSVATAKPPSETNVAEAVFENAWRSIVVIRQGGSQGSGIIVRPNVVATNCHVVDFYGKIVIYKHDNRRATADTTFNAVVRYRDDYQDFCLLDVAGLRGNSVKVRRYDTLNIGEDVYAVGSPKGLDLSLSSGIISQLRQDGGERYIQTDASVSPGSSGGGLFDSDGNLVGILTSKLVDEEVEGIGFAIPAELILDL